MKIKFVKNENVKTFTIISAIALILFQVIKSFAAIGGNFATVVTCIGLLDYVGFRAVSVIAQSLFNCLAPVIALASAVVLGVALFSGKKNKLPVIGAAGFAVAEALTLLPTGLFGIINLFGNESILTALVSLVLGVLAQLVFVVAYVVFFAIVLKGCKPESKVAAYVDKIYAKLGDNTLYVPGALLLVGGIVALITNVITALLTLIGGLHISYIMQSYFPLIAGNFGTIILYAIKGMILAIIGMVMTDSAEPALEQPPVVEQIAYQGEEM